MSKTTHRKKRPSLTKSNDSFVSFKADVGVEYYAISKEILEQLNESSGSSIAFDLSLFFFALSVGLFTTVLTTEIRNHFLLSLLIIVAASSFVTGIFKYMSYRKNKKKISSILKRVKSNKCSVI